MPRTTARLAAASLAALVIAAGAPALPARAEPPPSGPAARSGEVNLRPRFRKGEQTRFIMTIDSTGATRSLDADAGKDKRRPDARKPATKPGKDDRAEEQTMKQEIGLLLRVKEADADRGATVELVYESLKLDLRTPDMEFEFDSTQKPGKKSPKTGGDPASLMPTDQDLVEAMLRPMVGATITLEVDPDGNITSATGGGALSMTGMLGAVSAMSGGSGLTGALPTTGGGGGDVLGSIFTAARGRGSARVGESWTTTDKLDGSGIGSFTMTNKTTLKSYANAIADLAFEGRIVPGSSEAGAGLLGGSAQVKESDFTGRAGWDTERGMLKTMTSEQRTVMDASVPDGEGGQREVSLTSRTRVNVKRVD